MPFSTAKSTMDVTPSNLLPLAKHASIMLPAMVEMLDTVSELAQLTKPNQSHENIHIQELWALRKTLIAWAAMWSKQRGEMAEHCANLAAEAENLAA
jgi:hypothetical protein